MKSKLSKILENSDLDSDVKDFIIESLAINDEDNPRNIDQYMVLVDKYVGVKK